MAHSGQVLEGLQVVALVQASEPSLLAPFRGLWCLVELALLQPIKRPRLVLGSGLVESAVLVELEAWECLQVRWCLSPELELELELEQNLGKCLVWGSQVYTQVECSQAQEFGSLVSECFLGFPLEQELSPKLQVEVEPLQESQGLGLLGVSSLEFR